MYFNIYIEHEYRFSKKKSIQIWSKKRVKHASEKIISVSEKKMAYVNNE